MSDSTDGEIIVPPNLLRAKVGTGRGPGLGEILAAAEAALGQLKDQFEIWIRDDLEALNQALADARGTPLPGPDAIERIRKHSHEIKGHGATFGYPLLTDLGHMLHGFIDGHEPAATGNLNLIAAHVDFMNLIVREGIRDLGGPRERHLLAGLEAAVNRVVKT